MNLNEEQRLFRDSVRNLVEKEVIPEARPCPVYERVCRDIDHQRNRGS